VNMSKLINEVNRDLHEREDAGVEPEADDDPEEEEEADE